MSEVILATGYLTGLFLLGFLAPFAALLWGVERLAIRFAFGRWRP